MSNTLSDWKTFDQLVEEYPAFTKKSLTYLMNERKKKKAEHLFKRFGRLMFISESRLLEYMNGDAA